MFSCASGQLTTPLAKLQFTALAIDSPALEISSRSIIIVIIVGSYSRLVLGYRQVLLFFPLGSCQAELVT